MIQAVTTSAHRMEFGRRLAGKPYFEATMGTHCTLFGAHPASGWRFYLLPGSAALALRGGTATLCGQLPAGEAGAEAEEELQGFLRFLGADRLLSEGQRLEGWQTADPLLLWTLPQGSCLQETAAPPMGLRLQKQPSMLPVSQLVFPDSKTEQEQFYSMACTSLAHGIGCCRTLQSDEGPVCTVGCYETSEEEVYLSAGVTAPAWRGRGLAGWLIVHLANELAKDRTVRFASAPELRRFYQGLGFTEQGKIQQFTRKWESV